jgi:hypothetical protein
VPALVVLNVAVVGVVCAARRCLHACSRNALVEWIAHNRVPWGLQLWASGSMWAHMQAQEGVWSHRWLMRHPW